MPLYELFCIAAHNPTSPIHASGGVLRDLRNLGIGLTLPMRMRRHQQYFHRGEVLKSIDESLNRDPAVVRWTLLKKGAKLVQSAYREALVYSKKAIMRTARDRRHERTLDREKDGPSSSGRNHLSQPSQTEMGGDDALQTKTNEVTDALRRTSSLMQAELERSVLTVQMLDGSTNTLQLTQTLYDTYHHLLLSSNTLIKALERADWTDRLLILAALVLFLLVVGWILKRRVLDKVTGGIGWWFGASWRLVRMGVRGTSRKESSKDKGGTTVSKWMTGDGVTEAIAQVISSVVSTGTAGGNGGRAEITTKAVVGLVSSLVGIGAAEAISGILIESTTAPTQEEETGHSPWLASVVSHPSSESSAVDTESVPQMDESSPSRQRDEL
ncbi:MAG: hypothetical protein TREMPRED_002054 [Tremellales sp. Tagirdzhanova-0007]|nr:MAG: hypothetical protein TREMPRED_002054 [Tremellales sp. Tagirdzhanova-0007]